MTRGPLFLALVFTLSLIGCSGSSTVSCDIGHALPLASPAAAPWPKFRHDDFNTGRTADSVDLSTNTGVLAWQFPTGNPAGAFAASPAILRRCSLTAKLCTADTDCPATETCTPRVAIGSNDGNLYMLDADTGNLLFTYSATGAAIVSSAALDAAGTLFVGTATNLLLALNPNGTLQHAVNILGFAASSPAIATDGTSFIGASSGVLSAVCTNAVVRWIFAGEPFDASPALGPDGTLANGRVADCTVSDDRAPHGRVYVGSNSFVRPYVRAIDRCNARVRWTFAASAAIVASPALEVNESGPTPIEETLYVADQGGRLFALNLDATKYPEYPVGSMRFELVLGSDVAQGDPIIASPALGFPDDTTGSVDTVYVASASRDGTRGTLYAVDTTNQLVRAAFPLGSAIQSSPAVAHYNGQTAIVFGSDDGRVHLVVDDGATLTEPTPWPYEIPSKDGTPVRVGRASPAIDTDGTVYIGAEDGYVYAIGIPSPQS